MGYTAYGPFTNGGAPGMSSAFLNGVENFLVTVNSAATDANVSSNGNGAVTMVQLLLSTGSVKRIARFSGTGPVTAAAHGLGDVPDIVLLVYSGNFGSPPTHPLYYYGETSTTVHVVADASYFWYGFAIKF